jgi:predicted RNA-binding protein (virulence factor B family)
MIEIGKYNTLKVLRETSVGAFLGDDEGHEVLLPGKYVPKEISVDSEIEVFVYRDSEDRLVSTNLRPKIQLHQFAVLQAVMVNQIGAFLDWGLEKNLFVPFREQGTKMLKGRWYMVYLYLDEQTDRLVASAKINRFLNNEQLTVKEGDEVEVMIWETTDLGVNVIINNLHKGLVYHNEFFAQVTPGDIRKGYISKIRDDHKIDVQLQMPGVGNIEPSAARILEILQTKDGFLPLTDNSEPEEIARHLEMSKKTFKKAIGSLYKQKIIMIEKDGIRLIEK